MAVRNAKPVVNMSATPTSMRSAYTPGDPLPATNETLGTGIPTTPQQSTPLPPVMDPAPVQSTPLPPVSAPGNVAPPQPSYYPGPGPQNIQPRNNGIQNIPGWYPGMFIGRQRPQMPPQNGGFVPPQMGGDQDAMRRQNLIAQMMRNRYGQNVNRGR